MDLVIFTCAGREHLLSRTWRSWAPVVAQASVARRLLALDGPYNLSASQAFQPDVLVQSTARKGYIASILRCLALIDCDFLFWLEDDWIVSGDVNVGRAMAFLLANPNCLQVRWSKRVLGPPEKELRLADGIFSSETGFSANPCICRTDLLKHGFSALAASEKGARLGIDGFENFLTRWCGTAGLFCAVFDPGEVPAVSHIGDLESTSRKWHMTSSLDRPVENEYLWSAGSAPPLWRRLWMVLKLAAVFLRLGPLQLWDGWSYDFAFRIVSVFKNGRERGGSADRAASADLGGPMC